MSTAVVAYDRAAIQAMSPDGQRQMVAQFIEQGRDMLARAIEASDIQGIAGAKGAAATVSEMTRQLNLSKEARVDAEELVRRAEFALGKAIRAGQDAGTVARHRQGVVVGPDGIRTNRLPSVEDIEPHFYSNGSQLAQIADSATPEQFEEALARAKAEGNVSRANVARKIRNKPSPGETRAQRAERIAVLAQQGYTSQQIADKVGVGRSTVTEIARDFDITIHADAARGKRARINAQRVLTGAAESVEAAAFSLQQIDPLELDRDEAQEWVDSLTSSLSALSKATRKIKESFRDQV